MQMRDDKVRVVDLPVEIHAYLIGDDCASALGSVPPWGPAVTGGSIAVLGTAESGIGRVTGVV